MDDFSKKKKIKKVLKNLERRPLEIQVDKNRYIIKPRSSTFRQRLEAARAAARPGAYQKERGGAIFNINEPKSKGVGLDPNIFSGARTSGFQIKPPKDKKTGRRKPYNPKR